MLIRHKIILWFIGFSGLLLFLFSVYIYIASNNSRQQLFEERLKNKAIATKEIYELHDKVAERIITTIPEQSEYVFDANNKLIFAINDLHDFVFTNAFFEEVRKQQEKYFEYTPSGLGHKKEGYGFAFGEDQKQYVIITAYDKTGVRQMESLAAILVIGNLFFLVLISASAYLLSKKALAPLNDLVTQAESVQSHDLKFRLQYINANDEIGIVAIAFNKILERVHELVESQRSFISYASHELRTPLAAISGILETSLSYDNDVHSAKKSLESAQKEIQKAIGLVNGLLQLAKIESVDGVVEKERLNIVDLILDAITFFKLKQPLQEFLFHISDKKTEDANIELHGNANLLRTALINIIDNASKYSHQKKIEINLSIISSNQIKIEIIDSGIGIPTEDLKFVSNPFFRGANTFGIDGFGLGLALVQRITTIHQGELMFLKNKSQGMTVVIIFPAITT